MRTVRSDVVVVGSGLAGVAAALEAARAGACVALITSGGLCGGSSFGARTWGLGMVTTLDQDAERRRERGSLYDAVMTVGAGQSNPALVDVLVADGPASVEFLKSLGATVSEPVDSGQREYVPCFDDRVRGWHGFHSGESRAALRHAVHDVEGIAVFEHTTALSLLQLDEPGSPVTGVVARCHTPSAADELVRFEAPSVVLATGGLAGVFAHTFGGEGYMAATMALDAGAAFTNVEFLQLMLAFVSQPYGTICNEKLWRHASVLDEEGVSVLQRWGATAEEERAVLEAHSWHGPFTTARESRSLELAVQAAIAQGHHAHLHLSGEFLAGEHPEFVDTYLGWLEGQGADPKEPAEIALFAHSSNGGIAIDTEGATSVPGLFAAGECAGGVHGADRIGGLASVTALVFGRRAGRAAAKHAARRGEVGGELRVVSPCLSVDDAAHVLREVGRLMDERCLVNRSEEGLRAALDGLHTLEDTYFGSERILDGSVGPNEACDAYRARGKVVAARLLAKAMLRRTESLGSHHRV